MKERPIVFNGEMVRAIMEGRKTQTRRLVRPQPKFAQVLRDGRLETSWDGGFDIVNYPTPLATIRDRLWVRETWGRWTPCECGTCTESVLIRYKADWRGEPVDKWRPSIHMPRALSRITLEVTAVRAERLQQISAKDALAEGVDYDVSKDGGWPLSRFQALWDSVYGNWKDNPWVWVIEFKKI